MPKEIEILQPGMLTCIQDEGRSGYRNLAVPKGGVLDLRSMSLANMIVGNYQGRALLEMHQIPAKIKFHADLFVTLTGADMQWKINGLPTVRSAKLQIEKGSVLSGSPTIDGMRAYMAIQGAMELKYDMDSAATFPACGWGGIDGNYLKRGDFISMKHVEPDFIAQFVMEPPEPYAKISQIQFAKGPEWDYLLAESKERLQIGTYAIHPQHDRMGVPLIGPSLHAKTQELVHSAPVYPGTIQLLPSGKLMVLLNDCQTTGGYPRIGIIEQEELNKLVQIMIDQKFQLSL